MAGTFPLGYTSSHQGKHLCVFCPESGCWAHCRRSVISEAALHRTSASTWSTELLWREQTGCRGYHSICLARPTKPYHRWPVSSNTRRSSRPQHLRLCYASLGPSTSYVRFDLLGRWDLLSSFLALSTSWSTFYFWIFHPRGRGGGNLDLHHPGRPH